MRLEDDIAETAIRICDQLASAVERYVAVSGMDLGEIPEGFLRDHVFNGLGDVLTMTLETKNSTLWEWNNNARSTNQPQPEEFENQTRPDLVIFTGDHTNKSEMNFLCLVEIKKWWHMPSAEADLSKIDKWFHWLDTCQYGMLCAFVMLPNDEEIEKLKVSAIYAGHQWLAGRVARPLESTKNYQPFARILTNKNFRR